MRVGVVGAGITGLSVTHFLAARGVDVVTFEAASEPGGVVRSERVEGRVHEYGPQRARHTEAIADLIEELGLADQLVLADGDASLYVYANGGLREVPRSIPGLVRTDLLSVRGKLRLLYEPLTEPLQPGEHASEFFARKFGPEVYRNVIEPLFGGIYGSDPDRMPAEYALEPIANLEGRYGSLLRAAASRLLGEDAPPPMTFEEGLQTLPTALYEAHRQYVHLDTPVDAIHSEGGGYRLDTGGNSASVDAVVVTTPAPAARALLGDLETADATPLSALAYNSLVLVQLSAETGAEGFGYQVHRDESMRTLGVTWNDGIFDRAGLSTAFLGGMYDPDLPDLAAEEIGAIARREFETVMGVEPTVREVTTLPDVIPAYDESWHALADVDLPEGIRLATNYTERLGLGARVRHARRVAADIAATS